MFILANTILPATDMAFTLMYGPKVFTCIGTSFSQSFGTTTQSFGTSLVCGLYWIDPLRIIKKTTAPSATAVIGSLIF